MLNNEYHAVDRINALYMCVAHVQDETIPHEDEYSEATNKAIQHATAFLLSAISAERSRESNKRLERYGA